MAGNTSILLTCLALQITVNRRVRSHGLEEIEQENKQTPDNYPKQTFLGGAAEVRCPWKHRCFACLQCCAALLDPEKKRLSLHRASLKLTS